MQLLVLTHKGKWLFLFGFFFFLKMSARLVADCKARCKLASCPLTWQLLRGLNVVQNPSCFSPNIGDAFRRVRQAAARGHGGCVSRLCRNAEVVDVQLCTTAVTQGDSWFLQWLLSNFELVTGSNLAHSDRAGLLLRLAHHAATHGQLACLKQVMETLTAIGARLHESPLAAYAARGGHVTCLRYMCTDHHLALTGVVAAAARGGHFSCLQFAYERDAVWEMDTTAHLAFGGHVRCLRYAHERGAPLWYKASDEAQAEADGKVLVRVFPTKASLLRSPSTARRLGLAMQAGEGQQSITCDLNDSWLALAYAQSHGAPLGKIARRFVAERRATAAAIFL